MTGDLQIAPMSPQDLGIAVDWAAAEGWNPGLHDAEAFHRVDPDGFLMGWLNGTPVSAISVVRHSDRFGFLGFYLCLPDHRGKGYGMATWRAGMAHLGDRIVGLDGVPAQEANYMRSGFTLAHYTQRYAGSIRGAADPKCRRVTAADMPAILQMDLSISGTNRSAYISSWLSETPTRQTLVCETGGQVKAVGTIRSCRQG
ncbi:MAG: GNAT family N-acetyltransferase, partial [Pseudomonadota bacterium]